MMNQLISLAEELRDSLQERMQSVFYAGAVQGATLELDRYWLEWSLARWLGEQVAWKAGLNDQLDFLELWLRQYFLDGPRVWNFNERPNDWDSHCEAMGLSPGASPVRIRVILRRPLAEEQKLTSEGLA